MEIKLRVEQNNFNIEGKLKDNIVVYRESGREPQEKTIEYTENGEYTIKPDTGYVLEKANVKVNVPLPEGYIKPDGTIDITSNGEVDVTNYEKANVNIAFNNDVLKGVVSRTITKITAKDLEGLISIGDYAFYGCSLAEIEIPNTITITGRNCFQNNKFEKIVIPDNITTLGIYFVQGCTNLKEVTIGKGIKTLGNGVFDGCTALEYVEIPDNVTSISWYVFQRCSNLKKLKIGTGITGISGCFNGCNSLKEIICLAENPPKFDAQNLNQLPADCIFKVPAGSIEAYKNFTNWSARADYIIAYEGD